MQRQNDGITRIPSPWIQTSTALCPSPVDEGLSIVEATSAKRTIVKEPAESHVNGDPSPI
jgi:hypothetical protein